jgi:hypothetical protein
VAVHGEVKMKSAFNACSALLAFGLGAVGCAEPEVHTERAVFADAVQSVTVDVGSGDVRVRGDDVGEVNVTARVEGASNHLGHALTGGKLSLVDDCHENHCSVDIDVVVPAGVAVEVHTGSGDIALDALLGSILVRTGSGDVLGSELAGVELSVETGSGGSWSSSRPGQTTACSLGFTNPAADDYRLPGSDRGVDWAPADQHYGP